MKKPGDCSWLLKMLPPFKVGVLVGPNRLPVMLVNPGVCDAVDANMVLWNGLAALGPKLKPPEAGVCMKPALVLLKRDGAVPGLKADADVAKLKLDGELLKGEGVTPHCAPVLLNAGAVCWLKMDGLLAGAKTDPVCGPKRLLVVDAKPPPVGPNAGVELKLLNDDPG